MDVFATVTTVKQGIVQVVIPLIRMIKSAKTLREMLEI